MDADQKRLVLFDGVCNFCNWAVLFIVDRDPVERFHFASLQSDAGQKVLAEQRCDPAIESVVLVEDGRAFLRSTAALRIARGLKWPWPLLFYLFIWIPRVLRDAAYRYFSMHRYQWFGKSDQCRIPTPELKRRIVA
jgi:predicted DCC family thiol-disulfide oxidoreductase YuxK